MRGVRSRLVAVLLATAAVLLVSPALASAQTSRTARHAVGTPTAARALPRGVVLTAEDIAAGESAPSSLIAQRSALIGWTTRRVIAAGEPLRAPAVAPPSDAAAAGSAATRLAGGGGAAVVRAGQKVVVVYRDAGLELRLGGVAAQDGAVGARVGVRLDARRRLEGTVVAPGVVRLN
jgi:flagella basal body P-ring formation protein FlgA